MRAAGPGSARRSSERAARRPGPPGPGRAAAEGADPVAVPQPIDDAIEPDAARCLEQDEVAVAEPVRDDVEGRLRVRNADDPVRVQPGPCGALGDPGGALADHDEPVDG